MKISLRYLGINAQTAWDRLVQEHLNLLQKLTSIESAQVVLERQRDTQPPCRARVVLVVPGPDFHADAADHTPAAALRKAVENLKRQVRVRQTHRRVKGKSNLHLGVEPPGRGVGQANSGAIDGRQRACLNHHEPIKLRRPGH